MNEIVIGTRRPGRLRPEPRLIAADPELEPHLDRPWLRAYVNDALGLPPAPVAAAVEAPDPRVAFDRSLLARHALVCGATGSGKTRCSLYLLVQFIEHGRSVVLLDPKGETADLLAAALAERGYPAERLVMLDPRSPGRGVPGWNPLSGEHGPSDWVSVMERTAASWGPRLGDLLANACCVLSAHGLTVFELVRFLGDEAYRERLLSLPSRPEDPAAWREADAYFGREFAAWGKSERANAASVALNKLRSIMRVRFLRSLFAARKDTLALASSFHVPRVVLVRLDRPALGDEGARLLAGLLVNQLLRAALREQGRARVPVVLAIDELPALERAVGPALVEVVTIARSAGLSLLLAFQHAGGLSGELRQAAFANVAVQAFFRQGHADARIVAEQLAMGERTSLARAVLSVDCRDRQTGRPVEAVWRHRVEDAWGRPLRLAGGERVDAAWWDGPADPVAEAYRWARASGVRRLFVRAADTGEPAELARYVAGLTPGSYWIERPSLWLSVAFPRPKLSGAERWGEKEAAAAWAALLEGLPVQHAVARAPGMAPAPFRAGDVPEPRVAPGKLEAYLRAAGRANGQSSEEAEATLAWREREVARIAGGYASGGAEDDDGSF